MEAVWWQEGQSCRSWYRYAEHWLRTALASIYNTNHIGFTIFLYKLSIIASCIHKCNLRCYIWNSDRGQQNKTKIRNLFWKMCTQQHQCQKKLLSSSPLIVSQDSFSPWTYARFQTARALSFFGESLYIFLKYSFHHLTWLCNDFYDLSALVSWLFLGLYKEEYL